MFFFIEEKECQYLGQTFFSINFSGYITSTNLKVTTVSNLRHTKVSVVLKDMNKKKDKTLNHECFSLSTQ